MAAPMVRAVRGSAALRAAPRRAALRHRRLHLQQEQQEAALCAAGAAAGSPQPQPRRGGRRPAQQDQPVHPGAAPRHHGPGPRQAVPALWEDRLHQSHPGQDDQQVQRLRLRRLRQPHGGPEGRDGAQGQRGAGADGQATGAGPHQPLHLQPAAGGGRAGAGGAAEALRAGGVHPHPARPPRGQPRRGLRTDGVHGEVRGRHHPLQREVHQDAPGGASPPGPAALQVRGRRAEEAAEPGQVRAQREGLGPGRRGGHRDLGLRPRDGAAERVLPGALRPGPQPHDGPDGAGPVPAVPRLLLPGPRPRLDAPVVPHAAHGRRAGPRRGPRRLHPALRDGPPHPAARAPLAGQRRHIRARRRRAGSLRAAVPAGPAVRRGRGGGQRPAEPRPRGVAVRARRLPLPLPQVAAGPGAPGAPGPPAPPPPPRCGHPGPPRGGGGLRPPGAARTPPPPGLAAPGVAAAPRPGSALIAGVKTTFAFFCSFLSERKSSPVPGGGLGGGAGGGGCSFRCFLLPPQPCCPAPATPRGSQRRPGLPLEGFFFLLHFLKKENEKKKQQKRKIRKKNKQRGGRPPRQPRPPAPAPSFQAPPEPREAARGRPAPPGLSVPSAAAGSDCAPPAAPPRGRSPGTGPRRRRPARRGAGGPGLRRVPLRPCPQPGGQDKCNNPPATRSPGDGRPKGSQAL